MYTVPLLFPESCLAMGPLIDQELEEIDRRHASLTAANRQLVDALNFYQTLMKDYSTMPYNSYPVPDVMRYPQSVAQPQVFYLYYKLIPLLFKYAIF